MDKQAEQIELRDAILTRAAEQLGDITEPVLNHYYARHPTARQEFSSHASATGHNLEGDMVESVLYYLMEIVSQRTLVDIALAHTAGHHLQTLHIPKGHFIGLIEAVHETIAATIPEQNTEELALWDSLRAALDAICSEVWDFGERHLCPQS